MGALKVGLEEGSINALFENLIRETGIVRYNILKKIAPFSRKAKINKNGCLPQMSASVVINEKLFSKMPPSSLKVYEIIKTSKPLRFQDIASQTNYSTRTVRYALRDLKEAGLIGKIPDINDMRRCYYTAMAYRQRFI